jgi:hypothetical protein
MSPAVISDLARHPDLACRAPRPPGDFAMIAYAVLFCAGFSRGPMRCTVQPDPNPRSLRQCEKIAARHQKTTGPTTIKLPNGLIAVRLWKCVEKTGAEAEPAGAEGEYRRDGGSTPSPVDEHRPRA